MAKRFFNLDSHAFDAKQEVISKSSFWLAKKRYAQWIIHKEGHLLDKPELEVKGIDVVRTSFPASFRKFMDAFLRKLLTAVPKKDLDDMILEFRDKVKTLDVLEIAKNTSVKFVSQDGSKNYNPETRRPFQFEKATPAQVKACLAYNDMIIKMGLEKTCEPIHHGQKIKWVYLKENPFGLTGMAFKDDDKDPKIIMDFINQYIDRTAIWNAELEKKLNDFYNAMRWEMYSENAETIDQFFSF
jgi:DNA polymerase elongation subunit (family B)